MEKAKRFVTGILVMLFLGSLAGCILVDRGGYGYHRNYGYRHSYRDRDGDRR